MPYLCRALLELPIDIDALQVVAAPNRQCLSRAFVINLVEMCALAITAYAALEAHGPMGDMLTHLIRPISGMSCVLPLATNEGKECARCTMMSI